MRETSVKFTTSEFARLHNLNKRTLHYYDEIGLFSPRYRDENNYRYYELSQGIELENILMLRELGMGIEEIRKYLSRPESEAFIEIADRKLEEIEERMRRLKATKQILERKKEQLLLCADIVDVRIEFVYRAEEYVMLSPYSGEDYTVESLMAHLMEVWNLETYKIGCGSYISVEKIKAGSFEEYNGIFSPIQNKGKRADCAIMPEGRYLCGYVKGDWNKIPGLYRSMLDFAKCSGVQLTGYAYEIGLNEFAISDMNDYVTQILIKVIE